MTVTVNKISKPKPPTNPLAFDPDTQPGELVMCIDGSSRMTRGEVYTLLERKSYGLVSIRGTSIDYDASRFINVHRLPDGTLAFGRGPAVAKPEPKLYTTDEVHTAPVGSLFANADQSSWVKYARRIEFGVVVVPESGHEEILHASGLPKTTWRRLATEHNVKIEYEEEA
jgi:hypothetical protein